MREIPRQEPQLDAGPRDLPGEARRLAQLLRLGHSEPALAALPAFTARVVPALGPAARKGSPSSLPEALGLLETLALAQARKDHVHVADILEHQLAPLLR